MCPVAACLTAIALVTSLSFGAQSAADEPVVPRDPAAADEPTAPRDSAADDQPTAPGDPTAARDPATADDPDQADGSAVPQELPTPEALLQAARAALLRSQSVSYRFTLEAWGAARHTQPGLVGEAQLLAASSGPPLLRIHGTLTPPEGHPGEAREFRAARSGTLYQLAEPGRQVVYRATGHRLGQQLLAFLEPALVPAFVDQQPFGSAAQGGAMRVEPGGRIAGVDCDVLVMPDVRGDGSVRWYLGRDDHLPRAMEREVGRGEQRGVVRLELADVRQGVVLEPGELLLAVPPGWREVEVGGQRAGEPLAGGPPAGRPDGTSPGRTPDGLLARGLAAPDFVLPTASGSERSLGSLRGQVVVIDFWATWCPPCRKALPDVQALHAAYAGRKLAVLGISTAERGGDPAAMLADKGCTYELLLHGERIAADWGVAALPTFYVLDGNGAVVYAARGYSPGEESSIRAAIDAALAEAER